MAWMEQVYPTGMSCLQGSLTGRLVKSYNAHITNTFCQFDNMVKGGRDASTSLIYT